MSTKTFCDFCEEPIAGAPIVTTEEKDGRLLDFCSTACFIDFAHNEKARTE